MVTHSMKEQALKSYRVHIENVVVQIYAMSPTMACLFLIYSCIMLPYLLIPVFAVCKS